MTTTAVRRLAFRLHETRPDGGRAEAEWALETLLSLAYDTQEPTLVDVLFALRPELAQSIGQQLGLLYVTAEQIDESGSYVSPGDDDWQAARADLVDEYAATLARLARLIRATP